MAKAKVSGTAVQLGSTQILSGSFHKYQTGPMMIFFQNYGSDFVSDPVVTLTPYWPGSNSPVGSIETVIGTTATSFTLTSENAGDNYYVNWIAIGPVRTNQTT